MSQDKDLPKSFRKKLIEHTQGTITLLSNTQKPERERCVVRAFLRCLGVPFSEDDLRVSQPEPTDVASFDARFQVTEVMGIGRKRHEEHKKRLKELEAATDEDCCEIDWVNPVPMTWAELVCFVEGVFPKKIAYPDTDLLVHIALGQRFLDLKSEPPKLEKVASSGWRSVSLVLPPYSVVLYASGLAPGFLKSKVGALYNQWPSPGGWYDR